MPASISHLRIGVFLLGASTFVAQVITLREFLMLFQGNELTLGLTMALWMAFVSIGALVYRAREYRYNKSWYSGFLLVLSSAPLILLSLLPVLRYALFEPALELGPLALVALFSITMGPYCFLAGWAFPWLVAFANRTLDKNHAGYFYSIEALGSLVVGIIINLLLVLFLPAVLFLSLLSFFGFCLTAYYAFRFKQRAFAIFLPIIVVLLIISIPKLQDAQHYLPYLKNAEDVRIQDTPNGRFIQFTKAGERYFYENNVPLMGQWQPALVEELVHFGMSQVKSPSRVLLIGQMFNRHLGELLKYPDLTIDFFCPDVSLRSQDSLFPVLWNKRVNVFWGDPVRSFRKSNTTYDLILVDLPKPATVRVNRFYSLAFFQQAKGHISDGGMYCLHLPVSGTYFDKSTAELIAILRKTLAQVFPHHQYVKAEGSYLMAGNVPLNYDLTKSIGEHNLSTNYLFSGMPAAKELAHNSRRTLSSFAEIDAGVNRNLFPVAYFAAIHSWLAEVGANSHFFWLLPLIIVLLAFVFMPVRAFGMFAVGYTASSFEFLLLMAFQVFFGYLYLATGFIIMLFMAGLSFGAYNGYRKNHKAERLLLLLILTLIFSLLIVWSLDKLEVGNLSAVVLGIILLIVSFFVGLLFSAITQDSYKHRIRVGVIYGADMLGSALGALLTAVYVLPGIGFYYTLLGLMVLNGVAWVRWNLQNA